MRHPSMYGTSVHAPSSSQSTMLSKLSPRFRLAAPALGNSTCKPRQFTGSGSNKVIPYESTWAPYRSWSAATLSALPKSM
eukprot:CAMPEP_0179378872 /NCGR_PEP_ID=MMETSP0797-20121207/89555_1 /TAXON_ID=47934 /ORGANISM="Dinophysis acuminata, Strain DAEP01" /LENGTH=79 /DNA_ID=CAMNT_0021094949 /DNA_START=170 /DNA_END=409 /DNA_ORIENTATION=-